MKFLPMRLARTARIPRASRYARRALPSKLKVVSIDQTKCIGCRACMVACPYDSLRFVWDIRNYYAGQLATPYEQIKQRNFDKGTVVKCNFCLQRLEKDRLPACVETCPGQDLWRPGRPGERTFRLIVLYRGLPFGRNSAPNLLCIM